MRSTTFTTDCYYHIYNRGVEKRVIFQDTKDYQRLLLSLEEFNNPEPGHISTRPIYEATPRRKLVEILGYCLMPTHYHLLLKQINDTGITQFMHKLGTGYTMFFNKRWSHSGVIFESTFKAKIIENDDYLIHLSRYIHLNPLEIIEPHWKEEGIKDTEKTKKFLAEYRWSSYPFYIKKLNSEIIPIEPIEKILQRVSNYEKFVLNWTEKDLYARSYEATPR